MSSNTIRLIAILFLVIVSASSLAAQSASNAARAAEPPRPPYLDPSLPVEQRVEDLVSRMTREEKASQMQDVARAIPRLGIPAYNWWNEGLHGDDPRYLKAVSTPKHFAVHSGPEALRHRSDVPVSPHDFADTYAPAFRATINEGRAHSVMCAYNSVRGEPACANHFLFDTLRNKWGFQGYVVSDCGSIHDIHQGHGFVLTLEQAAALAAKAGTDLSCGPEYAALPFAVENRLLTSADVDLAVKRLFEARFRLGMFDPPESVPWSKLTMADNDTPAHRQLALEAARKSIVLLKNDRNTLPLKPSVKTIAVIGPNADSLSVLLGNYNGNPSSYTTILEGIRKRFRGAKILTAMGSSVTETSAVVVPSEHLH